jgi:hypothetical protein
MKTPILVVLIMIMLIIGGTLSAMNKACKSGYHSWCAETSTMLRHHTRTRPSRNKTKTQNARAGLASAIAPAAFAIFAAILRASSLLSNLAAERRPGSSSK